MDEKLDAVIRPHPPLPFPNLRDQIHLEIDPVRIDAIIHARVWLDPVSVHIARIGLLCAKASVNEYVLNARCPERCRGNSQPLQKPMAPRRKSEANSYFFQCCPMVTGRQCTGGGIESRNHAISIITETNNNVNTNAVIVPVAPSEPGLRVLRISLHLSGGTQTPDSDLPPGVSNGRRRWRLPAEVFVLRRPDHRGDSEESTRQIETRDVGAGSFAGRHPMAACCSNAHLAHVAGGPGE